MLKTVGDNCDEWKVEHTEHMEGLCMVPNPTSLAKKLRCILLLLLKPLGCMLVKT